AALRERVVGHALRLPAARLERAGRGDLLSRVGDDVAVVAEAVVQALPALARALVTVVLTFAGLAAIDPRLALAGACAVPVQLVAVRWYVPRAGLAYARERVVSGGRAQQLLEAVGAVRTVRALGLAQMQLGRVGLRSQLSVDAARATILLGTRFWSRLNTAELVGTAAVLCAGFWLVRADALSLGGATAGALLFVRLFDPIGTLLALVDDAQRALAALARLVGVARLAPPPEPAHPPRPADAAVSVHGARYAYVAGHEVLHGVDLELAAGESVALVGVSGAGKTTLAKLVAGFLEPTAGDVRIGGVRLADLGPTALRRTVALVTQEVHVFAGPLEQDLRLARPGATDAALLDALDAVGALQWAQALPAGLATVVGDGGHTLTPAQAQQLALARLMLADPPVAVLDEATAEAGSAGARLLDAAAQRALRGRTAIVVAHRLTQAAATDRIVVLDGGRVAEAGRHADLVSAGGVYARLWAAWSAARPAPAGLAGDASPGAVGPEGPTV
ncbi:MAG: ATP-binding cassette, subfamily bacterial, partial [bacterium]